MFKLYFTQLSVGYLTQAIFSLVFVLYLVQRKDRSTSTRLLTAAIWGAVGYCLGRFFYKSLPLHSIWQSYAQLMQFLSVITMTWYLIQFSYHLPRFLPSMRTEHKIVRIVARISTIIAVIITIQITMFRTTSLLYMYILAHIGVGHLWALSVLLRRTVLFEEDGRSWVYKLIQPQTEAAQSNRSYTTAIVVVIAGSVISLLMSIGLFERSIGNLTQTVFTLLNIFLFALSYLNYATEPTTIHAKLVGIPLFFVLLVLGVLPFWGTSFYEQEYEPGVYAVVGHTTKFFPQADGGYTAVSTPSQFRPPSGIKLDIEDDGACHTVLTSFPFYGKQYDNICISDNGFVTIGETSTSRAAIQYGQLPIIAALMMDMKPDEGGAIWLEEADDHLTISWDALPNSSSPAANTVQLTLYPDGQIDITHEQIGSKQKYGSDLVEGAWLIGLQSGQNRHTPQMIELPLAQEHKFAAGHSILHSYQMTFRGYLDERMRPLIWLILAATALILLGIPIFIKRGLTMPLNNLIMGMKNVDDGDLTVIVPIMYNDDIGRMTALFNRMVSSLKQADVLKNEFLANTSHELRTPLNGIIGLAESMLAGASGDLLDEQERNLGLIALSGRRLASLVNDLLDFSKLKHEGLLLHQRPSDLHAITELVVMISMPLAQEKGVHLFNNVPTDLPLAHADEERLQQVLHNLIGNAVKFTETGEIEVSARVLLNNKFVELWVRDTGVGISDTQLEQIFKPFEQADNSTARVYGGTGLGLSISKKIVELHGGEIYVESQVGTGTTFRFTLPRCSDEEMEMEMAVRQTAVSALHPVSTIRDAVERKYVQRSLHSVPFDINQGKIIFVVDDEMVNLQVMINYLRPQGYQVITALSGKDGLQQIEDGLRPDLILLDVMMPRMTGYEMCEFVREQYSMQELPIIMLSARNQVSDLVRGFTAGANDYLTKPLSQEELLTRIRSHLQIAETVRAYGRFAPKETLYLLRRKNITDIQLGDQVEREMSILFADIHNFAAISERMDSEGIFTLINTIAGRLNPIIRQYDGFVDRYIGDSLMAVFPQTADDAVHAAIAIQKEITALNTMYTKSGNDPIKIGIGIHTDSVKLGILGEKERMESSIIADAVNVSAYIEQLTKRYDVGILISENSITKVDDPAACKCRFMDRMKREKQEILAVYEIFDGDHRKRKKAATQTIFEQGLNSYYDRDFRNTISCMKQVLVVMPDDLITVAYLEQAEKLLHSTVPDSWDGLSCMIESD